MISYAPLRNVLEERGILSLTKFERKTGLSSDIFYKITKDEPINLSTVEILCTVLELSVENLVAILDENGNLVGKTSNDVVTVDSKTFQNAEIEKFKKELHELKQTNAQLEALVAALRKEKSVDLPHSTLGQRVLYKRMEKGLTAPELAALIGMTTVSIYKIEDGTNTNPKTQNILSMCRVFECSPNWLLTGVE